MNIVINKFDLPCDLKMRTSFVYDKLGYSYENYKKLKK